MSGRQTRTRREPVAEPATPDALSLDSQLCFAVYATAHAFGRTYRALLAAHDLTYPQYLVLLVLWEEEGLTVKEIGQRLFLDSGTLTPLLKRLEAAGWILRIDDAQDGRRSGLRLTPLGEAQVVAVRQRRNDWLADRLARLSPEDRAALAAAGGPLLRLLECEP